MCLLIYSRFQIYYMITYLLTTSFSNNILLLKYKRYICFFFIISDLLQNIILHCIGTVYQKRNKFISSYKFEYRIISSCTVNK